MHHKKPANNSNSPKNPLRRSLDDAAAKQAARFPGVGVTLGSYKHNPFQDAKPLPRLTPRREPGRLRRLLSAKRIIIVLVLLVAIPGILLGGKFIYNAHKLFRGNILSILTSTKLKGEDSGRINILLAGNSADDAGHDGADLSDSILLVCVDSKG